MNKKIINIGIAAIVCVLYFPVLLMLLELTYVVPWIVPMGLTYQLQTWAYLSSMVIVFVDLIIGGFYMATGENWLKTWAYIITFLFFGCIVIYMAIAPIVIAAYYYLTIVITVLLFIFLVIIGKYKPKVLTHEK